MKGTVLQFPMLLTCGLMLEGIRSQDCKYMTLALMGMVGSKTILNHSPWLFDNLNMFIMSKIS